MTRFRREDACRKDVAFCRRGIPSRKLEAGYCPFLMRANALWNFLLPLLFEVT